MSIHETICIITPRLLNNPVEIMPWAFLSYLIGSIPFGLILTKLAGYGDIRQIGSGNIGATNVLRTGNKALALATLILDAGKGAFAVIFIGLFTSQMQYCGLTNDPMFRSHCDGYHCNPVETLYWCALAAIIGHMFPVWLKFKGGKGVATTLGALLAASPILGAAACIVWLITAIFFRYSSLAALVAILTIPFAAYIQYFYESNSVAALLGGETNVSSYKALIFVCSTITFLVFFKHRANIQRLFKGEEPKIGRKKEI